MNRVIWLVIASLVFGLADPSSAHSRKKRRHRRPAPTLLIERDEQGRMTRMTLPTGSTMTYAYSASGEISRELFADRNRNGTRARGDAVEALPPEGAPASWGAHLPPFRPRGVPVDLAARVAAAHAHESFAEYNEQALSPETYGTEVRDLPEAAVQAIQAQIASIAACAPEGAALLTSLLEAGRIHEAPAMPGIYGAVVPASGDADILLGPNWVGYLAAPGEWFPFQNKFAEDEAETRARYFGDSSVTEARLGNPSRRWFGILGLLHETGHVLQRDWSSWADLRDVMGFEYYLPSKIVLAQAQGGWSDPARIRVYEAVGRIFERWKTDVEAGATTFALDLLAACSPGI